MSRRKEIIKQAGIYTFSSQLTQLITIVAAILSRRFLGPAQMGIWATLQIIVEYSRYSTMGLLHGIAREIPYYVGKGKSNVAEEIKNVVFTTILGSSFLIGCGIFLFTLLTRGRFSPEVTYGLYFIAVIIVLQRLNDLMIGLLRCYKKFVLASTQMIWSAIVNATLVAVLTYFHKIYGFIWAITLSFIFNILYIHFYNNFHFRIQFNKPRFRALVKFGFPLMMIGIMTTVLRSIDKILVAKFLGFEALGFYSIAFMVCTYIGSFTNAIAIVLIPHLQEKFSASDNPKDLDGLLSKASFAYALCTPALIGFAWIVTPYLVTLILPKFVPGITSMRMLSLSTFFLALAQPYSDFLITIKKHFLLFPLLGITALVALGLNFWVIRSGHGIGWIASATSVAALFNFSVTYFFASRYLSKGRTVLQRYFIFLSSGAYLTAALYLIYCLIPADFHSLIKTGLQFLCFVVFYVPLLMLLERRFSVVALVREKFLTRKYAIV